MKKWFIPVLCFAALTFSGCVSDFREDDHVMTAPALMETVSIDSQLADDLRIIQTSKMKTEKGLEVVCIRARLKREGFVSFVLNLKNTLDLSYKFTWFDAQGKEVKSADQWYSLSLRPGAEFSCTSQAPALGISKVVLTIRKGLEKKEVRTVPAAPAVKPATPAAKPAAPAVKPATPAAKPAAPAAKPAAPAVKNSPAAKPAAPAAVKKAASAQKKIQINTNCLCGCANGETCYCSEDSGCPNAKKNKTK